MPELFRKFRFWLRRERLSDEMDEEMKLHVELRARANRARGVDAGDAAAAARRQFGNSLVLREQGRDAWGFGWLERAIQDLRYACRRLLKQRMVTVVAVLTLGLGIGANTAMFTLVDALLFRPAPADNPKQLVWISGKYERSGRLTVLSYADYQTYRGLTDVFSGASAFTQTRVALGGASPERVTALAVSGDYFQVLGLQPQSGRLLMLSDDVSGQPPVAVLTDALWKSHFGADPHVVNRTITINGHRATVIGIAPPGFTGLEMADVDAPGMFLPLTITPQLFPGGLGSLDKPAQNWLSVVARLRSEVRRSSAATIVAAASAHAPSQQEPDHDAMSAVVLPVEGGVQPQERGEIQPVLLLLLAVPALVLIVAAANVGNLLLASGLSRRTELSLRRALGATRGRIVRQLLAESFVLAVLAAVLAMAMAVGFLRVIGVLGHVPDIIVDALHPDARVLTATMAVGVLSMLMFGLFPALSATSTSLTHALKDEGTSGTGRHRRRLRSTFVIAQVAVSLTLLVTAGLFVQSLTKALRIDPGFDVRHRVVMSYDLELQGYSKAQAANFDQQLLERARAVPDVRSAALASTLPLSGSMWGTTIHHDDQPDRDGVMTYVAWVSDGYFDTLGISILRGRPIDLRDSAAGGRVAVVSEAFAQRLWPDGSAIGRRVKLDEQDAEWSEVVGIARDIKHDQLTEDARPFVYFSARQWPRVQAMTLVARSDSAPASVTASLTGIIHHLDRDLPVYRASTLEASVAHSVELQRAASALLAVFGVLALLLAALGIYGVAAHGVTLRTKEIGIRMSLGARASQVVSMIIGEGMRLTAAGVVAGVLLSLAVSQLLASFLFGLRATDTMTFVAGGFALCVVAALACYVPARRAARVDPLKALRHE